MEFIVSLSGVTLRWYLDPELGLCILSLDSDTVLATVLPAPPTNLPNAWDIVTGRSEDESDWVMIQWITEQGVAAAEICRPVNDRRAIGIRGQDVRLSCLDTSLNGAVRIRRCEKNSHQSASCFQTVISDGVSAFDVLGAVDSDYSYIRDNADSVQITLPSVDSTYGLDSAMRSISRAWVSIASSLDPRQVFSSRGQPVPGKRPISLSCRNESVGGEDDFVGTFEVQMEEGDQTSISVRWFERERYDSTSAAPTIWKLASKTGGSRGDAHLVQCRSELRTGGRFRIAEGQLALFENYLYIPHLTGELTVSPERDTEGDARDQTTARSSKGVACNSVELMEQCNATRDSLSPTTGLHDIVEHSLHQLVVERMSNECAVRINKEPNLPFDRPLTQCFSVHLGDDDCTIAQVVASEKSGKAFVREEGKPEWIPLGDSAAGRVLRVERVPSHNACSLSDLVVLFYHGPEDTLPASRVVSLTSALHRYALRTYGLRAPNPDDLLCAVLGGTVPAYLADVITRRSFVRRSRDTGVSHEGCRHRSHHRQMRQVIRLAAEEEVEPLCCFCPQHPRSSALIEMVRRQEAASALGSRSTMESAEDNRPARERPDLITVDMRICLLGFLTARTLEDAIETVLTSPMFPMILETIGGGTALLKRLESDAGEELDGAPWTICRLPHRLSDVQTILDVDPVLVISLHHRLLSFALGRISWLLRERKDLQSALRAVLLRMVREDPYDNPQTLRFIFKGASQQESPSTRLSSLHRRSGSTSETGWHAVLPSATLASALALWMASALDSLESATRVAHGIMHVLSPPLASLLVGLIGRRLLARPFESQLDRVLWDLLHSLQMQHRSFVLRGLLPVLRATAILTSIFPKASKADRIVDRRLAEILRSIQEAQRSQDDDAFDEALTLSCSSEPVIVTVGSVIHELTTVLSTGEVVGPLVIPADLLGFSWPSLIGGTPPFDPVMLPQSELLRAKSYIINLNSLIADARNVDCSPVATLLPHDFVFPTSSDLALRLAGQGRITTAMAFCESQNISTNSAVLIFVDIVTKQRLQWLILQSAPELGKDSQEDVMADLLSITQQSWLDMLSRDLPEVAVDRLCWTAAMMAVDKTLEAPGAHDREGFFLSAAETLLQGNGGLCLPMQVWAWMTSHSVMSTDGWAGLTSLLLRRGQVRAAAGLVLDQLQQIGSDDLRDLLDRGFMPSLAVTADALDALREIHQAPLSTRNGLPPDMEDVQPGLNAEEQDDIRRLMVALQAEVRRLLPLSPSAELNKVFIGKCLSVGQ